MKNKIQFYLKSLLVLALFTDLNVNAATFSNVDNDIEVNYINPEDVRLCDDGNEYSIDVKNISEKVISEIRISYELPVGFSYQDLVSLESDVSIEKTGNTPQFLVSSPLNPDESIKIVFKATASCGTYLNKTGDKTSGKISVQNIIKVEFVDGYGLAKFALEDKNSSESYNVAYINPVINVPFEKENGGANQSQQAKLVGETFSQEVEVQLFGNLSDLDKFFLQVDMPENLVADDNSVLCGLSYGNVEIDITKVVQSYDNNSYQFEIEANEIGYPNGFKVADKFKFNFCYKLNACSFGKPQIVTYNSFINCYGTDCIMNKEQGSVTHVEANPNLEFSYSADKGANLCGGTSLINVKISNNSDYPAFNLYLMNSHSKETVSYSNYKVGSDAVSGVDLETTSKQYLSNLKNGSIPILKDIDGDNNYGDLGPGEEINLSFEMSLRDYISSTSCPATSSKDFLNLKLSYDKSNCPQSKKMTNTLILRKYFRQEASSQDFPTDVFDGDEFTIKHCSEYKWGMPNVNILDDAPKLYSLDMSVPCGYIPTGNNSVSVKRGLSPWIKENLEFSQNGNDISYQSLNPINFTSSTFTSVKACYDLNFKYECSDNCSGNNFSLTAHHKWSDCPNKGVAIGCEDFKIYPHCSNGGNGDCSGGPSVSISKFDILRKTYGLTSQNGTQISFKDVKDGVVSNVKSKSAYACDVVNLVMEGSVFCGDVNLIHSIFRMDLPENITDVADFPFVFQVAKLNINDQNLVDGTLNSVEIINGQAVYDVVFNTLINNGEHISASIDLKVTEKLNGNLTYPHNTYSLSNFRGGWSFDNQFDVENSLGTSFELFSLKPDFIFYNQKGSCGKSAITFYPTLLIKGGTSGDDFPNEFRPITKDLSYDIVFPSSFDLNNFIINTNIPNGSYNSSGNVLSVVVSTPAGLDKSKQYAEVKTNLSLFPKCDFDIQSFNVDIGAEYSFFEYSNDCKKVIEDNFSREIKYDSSGDLVWTPSLPSYKGLSNVIEVGGNLTFSGLNPNKPWVNVTVPRKYLSVKNSNGNNPFSVNADFYFDDPNSSNVQYFMYLDKMSSKSAHYAFDLILESCEEDITVNIKVESGVSCEIGTPNPFLSNGSVKYCTTHSEIIPIELIRSTVNLDVSPYFSAKNPLGFCDEFCFQTQIYNDAKGDLRTPKFNLDVPVGLTLTKMEYRNPLVKEKVFDPSRFDPSNFDWSEFETGTIIDDIDWQLRGNNGDILTDLVGTEDPGVTDNNLPNYFQAKVCMVASCDYNLAESIKFSAKGTSNCGDYLVDPQQRRPVFEGIEEITNLSPVLSYEYEPTSCGNINVTPKLDLNIDISHFIGNIRELEFELPDGSKVTQEIIGTQGVQVLKPIQVTESSCSFEIGAKLTFNTNLDCNGQAGCSPVYSKLLETNTIEVQDGTSKLELILVSGACEMTHGNAEIKFTNNAGNNLQPFEVKIYCDADGDGVLNTLLDNEIQTIIIPSVTAGSEQSVYLNLLNLGSCAGKTLFAKGDLSTQCPCNILPIAQTAYTCCKEASGQISVDYNDCRVALLKFEGDYNNQNMNYLVDWGDGTTQESLKFWNPRHEYTAAGDYEITILTQTDLYCDEEIKVNFTVTEGDAQIDFQQPVCGENTVDFTSSVHELAQRKWSVNGEIIHQGQNFSYTFPQAGEYVVGLVGEQGAGCPYSDEVNITITGQPVVNIIASDQDCNNPGPITFELESQSTFENIQWSFGDGANASGGLNQEHIYADPGTYTVTATGTSSEGCPFTVSHSQLIERCCSDIIGTITADNKVCDPYEWNFSVSTNGGAIESVDWYIDDELTDIQDQSWNHLFSENKSIQITWDKTYGGSGHEDGEFIQQTSDGGYIVVGSTNSNNGDLSYGNNGEADYWIIKLDVFGNKEWDKIYGGSMNDDLESIQETSDGGYILAGETLSDDGDISDGNNGLWDAWIIKLDGWGNKIWDKTYGGSENEYIESVQQTSDGGYILAGGTTSNDGDISDGNNGFVDYWIIKLDAFGNKEWDKTYGGPANDEAESIYQTSDGGYIVAGSLSKDAWIIKLDGSGNKVWDKTYGGYGWDNVESMQQTSDGGFIICGWTANNGSYDSWIIKLDGSGNLEWDKTYGGSKNDYAESIQQTSDGGYIVCGLSESSNGDVSDGNNGGRDTWIIKLDGSGNLEWDKTYGGSGRDHAESIQQASDGGYIVTGYTESNNGDVSDGNNGKRDVWIIKLDEYPQDEEYTIKSIVKNVDGCETTVEKTITVLAPEVPVFNISSGCGLTKTFTTSSSDDVRWFVDDTKVGSGSIFDYNFSQLGKYTVKVENWLDGCFTSNSHEIDVEACCLLEGEVSDVVPIRCFQNYRIHTITTPGSNFWKAEWFLDGNPLAGETGMEIHHTYEGPGEYIISGKAWDNSGCMYEFEKTIKVIEGSDEIDCCGFTRTFPISQDEVYYRMLDFGDGSDPVMLHNYDENTYTHTFPTSADVATYTVKLYEALDWSSFTTKEYNVTITPCCPSSDLDFTGSYDCEGLFILDPEVTDVTEIKVNWGDGNWVSYDASEFNNITHQETEGGTYSYEVEFIGANNCEPVYVKKDFTFTPQQAGVMLFKSNRCDPSLHTYQITSPGSGFDRAEWYVDGVLLVGETGRNITHDFESAGDHDISGFVWDKEGCVYEFDRTDNVVLDGFEIDFTFDNPVCGFTRTFTVSNSEDGIYSKTFDFGDGSPSVTLTSYNENTVTHTFPTSTEVETYTVRLSGLGYGGFCPSTQEYDVTVRPCCDLEAELTVPEKVCVGDPIVVKYNSAQWPIKVLLAENDENYNQVWVNSKTFTYNQAGSYDFYVKVENPQKPGCEDIVKKTVIVEPCCDLEAELTVPEKVCMGDPIVVKYNSAQWPIKVSLAENDENYNQAWGNSKTFTYNQAGSYDFYVKVEHAQKPGCEDIVKKTVIVESCCSLEPELIVPERVCAGEQFTIYHNTVQFPAEAYLAEDDKIFKTKLWTNNTSSNFTYTEPGKYRFILKHQNTETRCVIHDVGTVTVESCCNEPRVPIRVKPQGCSSAQIDFKDKSLNYTVDWGDGTIDNNINVWWNKHDYPRGNRSYQIKIIVNYNDNCPPKVINRNFRSSCRRDFRNIQMSDYSEPDSINGIEKTFLDVYPNPTNQKVSISLGNSSDFSNLKIVDLKGVLVYSEISPQSEKVEVDVSQIDPGTYIVSVVWNNQILTTRLVVIH